MICLFHGKVIAFHGANTIRVLQQQCNAAQHGYDRCAVLRFATWGAYPPYPVSGPV